jgi:hypothetical protein
MATRTPIAFAAVFFLLQLFFPGGRLDRSRPQEKLLQLLRFGTPVLLVGMALMAMNMARFERPFEFGHTYLAGGTIERIQAHGLFGLSFLARNLAAALLLLPTVQGVAPFVRLSRHGMSLLLSTPPFCLLFAPRQPRPAVHWMLWITLLAVAIPLLFYQNTGHIQFGYRFSLDFTPLLMLLLAVGRRPLGRAFWIMFALAVLVNGLGAVTFKRFELLYDDHMIKTSWE